LARLEKDFQAETQQSLSLTELLELLNSSGLEEGERENAIACYLSAGEGWREAMRKISGAFADGETGLKERKQD
jgi:hypothetical protein